MQIEIWKDIEGHKSRIVLDTQTGIFYDTAKEAAYIKSLRVQTLVNRLNGHRVNNTSMIYV